MYPFDTTQSKTISVSSSDWQSITRWWKYAYPTITNPPPVDSPSDSETLQRILLELEHLKARIVALESRNEALENIVACAGHILVSVNGKES